MKIIAYHWFVSIVMIVNLFTTQIFFVCYEYFTHNAIDFEAENYKFSQNNA